MPYAEPRFTQQNLGEMVIHGQEAKWVSDEWHDWQTYPQGMPNQFTQWGVTWVKEQVTHLFRGYYGIPTESGVTPNLARVWPNE